MKHGDAEPASVDAWHRGNKHIKKYAICKCYELEWGTVGISEIQQKTLTYISFATKGVDICGL